MVLIQILYILSLAFSVNTQYVSEVDQQLDLRQISLLPVTDNVSSIYSNPIENFLREKLRSNHHWQFNDQTSIGTILTPNELEQNPQEVKRICNSHSSDSILSVRALKNPNHMEFTLSLFGCFDGKLLIKETNNNFRKFSTNEVLEEINDLTDKLLNKVPFHGRILSRSGAKVTLDLGTNDGVREGELVNVVTIIEMERHPRFHFLVSTKKQILGTVKIAKVDETLSFGVIEAEGSKNLIQPGQKVDALRFVRYQTEGLYNLFGKQPFYDRDDSKAVFGTNPREWRPASPPTIGGVALKLGLGTYSYNISLDSQNLNSKSSFYPSLTLEGDLWMTPQWTLEGQIRQGVVNVDNPLSGSNPSDISIVTTKIDLRALYNFLLYDDFFGPKLQIFGGFTNYITKVDSSNPISLTNTKYSGMHFGLRGSLPFGPRKAYTAGAELTYFLTENFKESPFTSGGKNDGSISSFRFFGSAFLNQNLLLVSDLTFENLQTTFSGPGTRPNGTASGSNEKQSILSGGIKFLW